MINEKTVFKNRVTKSKGYFGFIAVQNILGMQNMKLLICFIDWLFCSYEGLISIF